MATELIVGGWFASTIVAKVINFLVDYAIEDQPNWQGGLKEERKRLKDALPKVQALLDAVDCGSFLKEDNPALVEWMWQFRDAIEEAEDFMHDIEYQRLKKEIKGKKSKVSSAASCIKTIAKRALRKDASLVKLKEVVERLDKVVSGIGDFVKLIKILRTDKQPMTTGSRQRGSGSTVKTRVFGRVNEKEEVIDKLLNSNPTSSKNFSILPIVGVGGVGKTTLAQFVYSDEKIQKYFNKRMWVCVSNSPKPELLIQKIYESTVGEKPNFANLDNIQEKISEKLKSQRFLLVLDDVWDDINDNDLDDLLSPLKSGEMGSMILLTTRIKSVGETMMGKLEPVFLNGLSKEDFWEFFKEYAFCNEDPEYHMGLQDIGRRIAEKLKGSPLAAKTVGGILSKNLSYQHWEEILDSEIWKLEQNENHIMLALKLSYQYLPPHLKPCFRFCSIFPQDYWFRKEKLVYMWMALGLLHKSKSKYGTARPEDIGDEYLNDLVGKSFFDCKNIDQPDEYYVMHDLLHELATSVSNGECFRIGDSFRIGDITERVRHLSINTSVSLPIPENAKLKYLRTLLLLTKSNTSYCDIPKVLKGLKSLRILDSSYFQITDDCFSNLKHLCYLSNDGGSHVPESVNKLYHLQFLEYKGVSVELPAPDYISHLINLRRLSTPNSRKGIVYGLGRLTSLQILERLNVGEGNNVNKIVELKNLRELRELRIMNLEDATRVGEVGEANLGAKEHLLELKLAWAGREHGSPEVDEQVLDALQPHSNLKKLEIKVYTGRRIPCWMTVSKIISITLSFCKGIVDLSALGQLSHLESLQLSYMDSVKRVGSEAADRGIGNRVFSSLQKLHIQELPALEEFCGGASRTTQWLPCLKVLWINECPNLTVFSNLPCGLRKLDIEGVRWDALPKLWVQSVNNESLSSHLYSLEIESCPCLKSLAEGLLMHSELFTSLKNMVIFDCKELTDLPIGGFSKFTSLKDLNIEDCPKLRRGSTSGRFLPSSLQTLRVTDCDVLDPLPRSPEGLNFLSDMTLHGCAGITSLPSAQVLERLKALEQLHIENCSELESLGGLQALPSLKYLTARNCNKLVATASSSLSPSIGSSSLSSSFVLRGLQALSSLKDLMVKKCLKLVATVFSLSPSTGSSTFSSSLILEKLTIDDPLLLGTEQLKSISTRYVDLDYCLDVRSSALEWALKNNTTLQRLTISEVSSQQFPLAELERLSCLRSLVVYRCSNLQSLPELPSSLNKLWLIRCPPELEERCLKDSGPDWPKIQHIPDVRIGNYDSGRTD